MVRAPESALQLYKAIAKAAKDPNAFAQCHVYEGQQGYLTEPVVRFQGQNYGMAYWIASWLGLEFVGKMCSTPNCINPLHHVDMIKRERLGPIPRNAAPVYAEPLTPVASLEELRDTVEYYADKDAIRREDQTFERMRPLIPLEDMSDEDLKRALSQPPQPHP